MVNKNKIAISINSDLLTMLDSKIDGSMIRSRSQAIEYFLSKGLENDTIKTAVLLLKGSHQHVSLQKINGKSLIKRQVEFFRSFGIKNIYLVTQKPNRLLREELISSEVEIIDKEARGNADALLKLRDYIKSDFVAMSADTYNDFDITKMIDKHKSQDRIATMGLMTRENLHEYGVAVLDGDLIIDFREKNKNLSSHIVNAGIYILKPEVFDMIASASLEKDLFPRLAKIKQLVGFFTYGEYKHLS